jgi:NAD(P)-dependent dehydrogenase (short-subunit alcohol dehydrogenase family)
VLATVRGAEPTGLHETAAASSGRLAIEQLEMTDAAVVNALRDRLSGRELDLLFVNAGVANGADDRVDLITTEEFTRVMVTNALSPMRIVERLGDLVRPDGTIAVMSSGLGSVALNETGGWEVYRASKAALNTLMRSYAARHAGDRRSLALVDPGWVRTDMGGPAASLGVDQSIPGVADALEARRGQPGLRYFNYKGETVPW